MKRKFFSIIGAVVIVAAIVFNFSVSLRGESFSDITLANIEALARNEGGDWHWCCGDGCMSYYEGGWYVGCQWAISGYFCCYGK